MGKNKEKLNIFLLHFLERLNSNEPNERKVIESLTDFCNYYDFTKGFIYQTDGFRYFLLKETIGNEGGTMKPRFDMGELKKEHVDAMKARDKPFYGNRNADASWDDIDILDFYGEDSLLIRHFEDTEGKIIGFIGFAGREEETYLTEEELQIIHLLLGSFSKEIAVREYKEREVRASNTFFYEAVEDGFHICLYVRVCILVDGEACACMLDEQMQDSGRRKRWKVAYNLLCHQVKATPARG